MKLLTLFIFFASTLTYAEVATIEMSNVNVNVIYQHHPTVSIELPHGTRLAELLFDSRLPENIYWRSAQISNKAYQDKILADKNILLSDLKALQVQWMLDGDKGSWVQSSQQLLLELDRLDVTGRLSISLDPAVNRAQSDKNPLLVGNYTLFVAPRSQSIYFMGLINGQALQPIREGAGLADYWKSYSLLAGADLAQAYLIQPSADIIQVPVASWNKLHREPMAGATLFVGFDKEILPAKYKNINNRIANLIANRIPE